MAQRLEFPFPSFRRRRSTLAKPEQVTLRIYNMLGQLVKTVVDEHQSEGYYKAVWDGRNETGSTVASGIYIYRMIAGRVVDTKRMLFVK